MSKPKAIGKDLETISQDLRAISVICHCAAESTCELRDDIFPFLGFTLGDLAKEVENLALSHRPKPLSAA